MNASVIINENGCSSGVVEYFSEYLKKDKGSSEKTIQAYVSDMELFYNFIKKDLKTCNEHDITQYKYEMVNKNLAPATINRRISAIRTFYSFLKKEKIIQENPADAVGKLKLPKKVPLTLNEDKATMLLDAILVKGTFSIRDYAIFSTFLFTGCRVSEVVNLKVNDIDFSNNLIYIRKGKGNKDRVIPMIERLAEAMKTYLNNGIILNEKSKAIKHKCGRKFFVGPIKDNEYLFVTRFSRKFSTKGIEYLFKQYCQMIDIYHKGLSLHSLRRTCLTFLYKEGVDLFILKEISGHARLQTLEYYLAIDQNKVKEAMQKHPLSSRGIDSRLIDMVRN